ncbi:MAG: hypothetical protein JWO76_458 [Nocardioides sp.]|nr:hypothetical protein [Nocardioides sp.]
MTPDHINRTSNVLGSLLAALVVGLVAYVSQRLVGESDEVALIGALGAGVAVAALLLVWKNRSVSRR